MIQYSFLTFMQHFLTNIFTNNTKYIFYLIISTWWSLWKLFIPLEMKEIISNTH